MTPEYTNQLTTELLLSGLAIVVSLGSVAAFVMMCSVAARRSAIRKRRPEPADSLPVHQPWIFESTCRWVAIKSKQVTTVQSALRLHNPIPCSWGEGVAGLS